MENKKVINKIKNEKSKERIKEIIKKLYKNKNIKDNELSDIYYEIAIIIEKKFNVNLEIEKQGLQKIYNCEF